LVAGKQVGFSVRRSQFTRLMRSFDGFFEVTSFGVGGGECADKNGLLPRARLTGLPSQLNSLTPVADVSVGMRGQEPGEVVQGDSRIWLQLQSFTILRYG